MSIRDEESSTPKAPGVSEAVTRGIRVNVEAQYAPTRSQPSHGQWFFLYTIRITNESQDTVQLVSRHWIISDATDHVEEVKGPGVVGHQPVLAPGESFEYTSGCHLPTPFGVMRGSYQMLTQTGDRFESEIAPFYLQGPYSIH
jgi:ApaG protein